MVYLSPEMSLNELNTGMIKHGKVVLGETPSVTGRGVSNEMEDSEPVSEGETLDGKTLSKVAAMLVETD